MAERERGRRGREDGAAPIERWLAEPAGREVEASLRRLARLPGVRRLAVMPDVHLAGAVCNGVVLASEGLIYPEAVGGDLGCGVAALALDGEAARLRGEFALHRGASEGGEQGEFALHRGASEGGEQGEFALHRGASAGGEQGEFALHRGASAGGEQRELRRSHPGAARGREDPQLPARLLAELSARVPASRHRRGGPSLPAALALAPLSPGLERLRGAEACLQLGTLGGGNHFLELQADEDERLWLMLHSGSRGVGQQILAHHLARARGRAFAAGALLGIEAASLEGQAYLVDHDWAVAWAAASRRRMLEQAAAVLEALLGVRAEWESLRDGSHNLVRREQHGGEELWVHRKGALDASEGAPASIPGSMGTASYHVRGRGEERALRSSSHGAGRRLTRAEARRAISPRQLAGELAGVCHDERLARRLCDEAPSAYRPIEKVMRAQRELTRIERRLRPLLCLKGG